MAETVTDLAICPKCEAEVRPDSVFCYNCGGRVAPDEAVVEEKQEIERRPAPGLRSARDIRRVDKRKDPAIRQFRWEPVAETGDGQLILTTILIVVFTLAVIALAFYLH